MFRLEKSSTFTLFATNLSTKLVTIARSSLVNDAALCFSSIFWPVTFSTTIYPEYCLLTVSFTVPIFPTGFGESFFSAKLANLSNSPLIESSAASSVASALFKTLTTLWDSKGCLRIVPFWPLVENTSIWTGSSCQSGFGTTNPFWFKTIFWIYSSPFATFTGEEDCCVIGEELLPNPNAAFRSYLFRTPSACAACGVLRPDLANVCAAGWAIGCPKLATSTSWNFARSFALICTSSFSNAAIACGLVSNILTLWSPGREIEGILFSAFASLSTVETMAETFLTSLLDWTTLAVNLTSASTSIDRLTSLDKALTNCVKFSCLKEGLVFWGIAI